MLKFDIKDARKLLPRRSKSSNKTDGGRTLIIAGSPGLYGAAVLSATAAARVGSGYTLLMTDLQQYKFGKHPDFLISEIELTKIDPNKINAVAVGPGLGVHARTLRVIKKLISLKIKNVVLDADALSVLAKYKLYPLPNSWILTPHTGELVRLYGRGKVSSQTALLAVQKKYGCIVVLKGSETKVFNGHSLTCNQSGNSALAKSGTGDVLTGMIAGFLSQGVPPFQAAGLAAFLHGYIADQWIGKQKDHLSLLASDLLDAIPQALFKIRNG